MGDAGGPPDEDVSPLVQDIRKGPIDEYWERLRHLMGPEGLITYWYLGRAFNQEVDPDTMRLRPDMRNASGGIMAAPLAISAPETGGWRDREVVPAPMTYSLHILDPAPDVREVRVTRETVRRGRKIGFSRSLISDADDPDRLIALTSGTGVTLGEAPPGFRPVDLPPDLLDGPLPPLPVVFGARRDSEGWRLPELTNRLASTSASLHLGPIHVVCEAAASEAAAATVPSGPARSGTSGQSERGPNGGLVLQVEDWEVHFAAPGRKGPFLVQADAWHSPGGRILSRFTLIDEGNGDAVVASGTAAFREAGPVHHSGLERGHRPQERSQMQR
jgi:acyl-coenzyme A thioesterase PaaI-like protein